MTGQDTHSIVNKGRADTRALAESVRSAIQDFITDTLHLMENLTYTDYQDKQEKYKILRGTVLRKAKDLQSRVGDKIFECISFKCLSQKYIIDIPNEIPNEIDGIFLKILETGKVEENDSNQCVQE